MTDSLSAIGVDATSRASDEETLVAIWQQILGVEKVDIDDNFFELGGDSLLGMQIVNRARQQGIQISIDQILHHQTIAGLSGVAGLGVPLRAEQSLVTGPAPLTPRQHQFFEQPAGRHGQTTPEVIGIRPNLDPDLLELAAKHLFIHHDALRMRFIPSQSGWQAFNAADEDHAIYSYADLSNLSEDDQRVAMGDAVKLAQSRIDVSTGPLAQFSHFGFGPDRHGLLLLTIHHLVVDALSVPILLEDLQTGYEQLNRGEPIQLPPKTSSFKQWAEQLHSFAHSPHAAQELSYWLAQPWDEILRLPADHADHAADMGRIESITVSTNADETRDLLCTVPRVCGAQIQHALLASLVRGFASWTGSPRLLVDLRSHGRDPVFPSVDVSRTVGWFTVRFPVILSAGAQASAVETMQSIGQQLRLVPNGGIGYGALRHAPRLMEAEHVLGRLPVPDVGFNYQGRFDRLYKGLSLYAIQRDERLRMLRHRMRHITPAKRTIQVTGSTFRREVSLRFDYHQSVYEHATVERVAQQTLQALRSLIRACRASRNT